MAKRRNKLNKDTFQKARQSLSAMFPQVSKKALYISDVKESGVLPEGMSTVAVSAVCEIADDSLTLRTYREPKEKSSTRYKVDEMKGVDKAVITLPPHDEIEDHYIDHDIPEDMMRRNQMTVEFVSDDQGDLRPNIQPDGMVKAYINFPDPIEEMKKEMVAKYGTPMPRPQDLK